MHKRGGMQSERRKERKKGMYNRDKMTNGSTTTTKWARKDFCKLKITFRLQRTLLDRPMRQPAMRHLDQWDIWWTTHPPDWSNAGVWNGFTKGLNRSLVSAAHQDRPSPGQWHSFRTEVRITEPDWNQNTARGTYRSSSRHRFQYRDGRENSEVRWHSGAAHGQSWLLRTKRCPSLRAWPLRPTSAGRFPRL